MPRPLPWPRDRNSGLVVYEGPKSFGPWQTRARQGPKPVKAPFSVRAKSRRGQISSGCRLIQDLSHSEEKWFSDQALQIFQIRKQFRTGEVFSRKSTVHQYPRGFREPDFPASLRSGVQVREVLELRRNHHPRHDKRPRIMRMKRLEVRKSMIQSPRSNERKANGRHPRRI